VKKSPAYQNLTFTVETKQSAKKVDQEQKGAEIRKGGFKRKRTATALSFTDVTERSSLPKEKKTL